MRCPYLEPVDVVNVDNFVLCAAYHILAAGGELEASHSGTQVEAHDHLAAAIVEDVEDVYGADGPARL